MSDKSTKRNSSAARGSTPSSRTRKPHFDVDPKIEEKLREIESSGEPISIAESISRDGAIPVSELEREATDGQDVINVTEIQRMTMAKLMKQAESEGIQDVQGMSRRDLISAILKERVKARGLMFGEGTLQILPDGFGFLRSPEYHYLNCPDDIYVSPSQIRKFNLRNGAIIRGQIRPPKENERYFALLRVETVNGINPMENARRIQFDDLTPLHPDTRSSVRFLLVNESKPS